ncbi:membrane protein insertion efficiency factor YidD [Helicobacter sp. MIT 14-3879]|uniref:membrane protein insertion efficiency factor YidD n=1 Tax=Helicobacter sp. MIT 14-3879 TaxID=2040649 RepID=UPI000E1F350B|nr:membrane protein insertion efficiency factor YidD [Helicobacter sp. MIT 14-3879]RDU64839.1 membrane protein insertion efficiency factor YidD [Helicobacter sp. MIT 14-3879]
MKIDKQIKFYKKYISPLIPPSCRFYPTCSEYAMYCFRYNNIIIASFKSIIRILKCNQLFSGGIEYPKAKFSKIPPKFNIKDSIICNTLPKIYIWLVPIKNNEFYIIKVLKERN